MQQRTLARSPSVRRRARDSHAVPAPTGSCVRRADGSDRAGGRVGCTGDSYDNALAENLWSTIKVELVN